jgi:hypothetical protein
LVAVLFRETPPATLEGPGLEIAGEIERALLASGERIALKGRSLQLLWLAR